MVFLIQANNPVTAVTSG